MPLAHFASPASNIKAASYTLPYSRLTTFARKISVTEFVSLIAIYY